MQLLSPLAGTLHLNTLHIRMFCAISFEIRQMEDLKKICLKKQLTQGSHGSPEKHFIEIKKLSKAINKQEGWLKVIIIP